MDSFQRAEPLEGGVGKQSGARYMDRRRSGQQYFPSARMLLPPLTTPPAPAAPQTATSLFRYLAGGRNAGSWEEVATNAAPQLYDAHEDSNAKAPEWHLEMEGAQVGAARRQVFWEGMQLASAFSDGWGYWPGARPQHDDVLLACASQPPRSHCFSWWF